MIINRDQNVYSTYLKDSVTCLLTLKLEKCLVENIDLKFFISYSRVIDSDYTLKQECFSLAISFELKVIFGNKKNSN